MWLLWNRCRRGWRESLQAVAQGPGAEVSQRGEGSVPSSCLPSRRALSCALLGKCALHLQLARLPCQRARECRSAGLRGSAAADLEGGVLAVTQRACVFEPEVWPQVGSGYSQESQKPRDLACHPPRCRPCCSPFPRAVSSRWSFPCLPFLSSQGAPDPELRPQNPLVTSGTSSCERGRGCVVEE